MKAEIQETYSVEITITKSKDKTHLENSIYIIDFKSQDNDKLYEAQKSLRNLFTAIKIKTVDEQSGNQIILAGFISNTYRSMTIIKR